MSYCTVGIMVLKNLFSETFNTSQCKEEHAREKERGHNK